MSSPEQQQGPEASVETPKVSAEHYEELSKKIEAGAELGAEQLESNETKADRARVEALETAISTEKGSAEKKRASKDTPSTPRRRGAISKKERNASFKKHMKQVQEELPAPQRAFSKLIHNPVVEKTSEFVGATIARPNAILAGSVVAFFSVLGVYLVAKYLGYVLSGFETIAAFIVGWVLGIVYDYLRVIITGKKS